MGVNYDGMWKGMLEEVAEDLLKFVFPNADEVFDFKRGCTFLDKELNELTAEPGVSAGKRHVDKLIGVFRKDGQQEWLLLHVEVQGRTAATFGERMFRYFCRIFDKYRHPITAIAIFTGTGGKDKPDRFLYNFMGTRLEYEYNTLCVVDFPDVVLKESDNIFALVMLAAKKATLYGKADDHIKLGIKLELAGILYRKGLFTNNKIRAIFYFLDNLLVFSNPEINHIFNERFDRITGKTNTMGIIEYITVERAKDSHEKGLQEGIEKGRLEERRMMLERLLLNPKLSDEEIAELSKVSIESVKQIRKELNK